MSTRRILLPGLCLIVMTLAVLQTMVIPIVGTIGAQLGVSTTAAGWVLTANLLAAVIATPVIGRLADLYGKQLVLVGVLVVVLVGSLLAALTDTLPLLLLGRVLQGVAYALFPIALAVLREEMPPHKLIGSMAILSGTLGVGGGIGLVVTGLLTADGADYHRVFWLTAAFVTLALGLAWFGVPSRPRIGSGSVDWWGALLLGTSLLLLFLALTQGASWGWVSPPTAGCTVAGVVVGALWWAFERRTDEPLVAPRMLTHRPLPAINVATLFVGVAMFVNFLACSFFVQTAPDVAGYGFGATVLEASAIYLLPGAAVGVVAAIVSGRFIRRFGPRRVLIVAAIIGCSGFVFVAFAHHEPWHLIVAGIVVNTFVSLAFAALPNLLIAEVPAADTGVANSVNSIVRTTGTSLASALLSTVLAVFTIEGTSVAREGVYTAAFTAGAIACGIVALAATAIRSTPASESVGNSNEPCDSRRELRQAGLRQQTPGQAAMSTES